MWAAYSVGFEWFAKMAFFADRVLYGDTLLTQGWGAGSVAVRPRNGQFRAKIYTIAKGTGSDKSLGRSFIHARELHGAATGRSQMQ